MRNEQLGVCNAQRGVSDEAIGKEGVCKWRLGKRCM